MKRFALLALPLALAACGDNLDEVKPTDAAVVIDAPVIDAQVIDAPPPIDAAIDARPITYSATVSLLEAQVLNPGASGTFFGQGLQIGVTFTSSDPAVFPGPVLEETPGSPLGCKAWDLTAAQAAAATIGLDEGVVQVTSTAGTSPPAFPPCVFAAGAGYICPETTTAQVGGTIAMGPLAGTATFTDADTTFTAANITNRYLRISGATNPSNNGAFPIVGLGGANTVIYANPGFVAETLPAAATHINLAGVGPTPQVADPGFLRDDNDASFVLTAGGGNHVPGFTMTTGAGTVGDDFTLAAASVSLMNAIPRTNAPFTLACDSASCAAGSGSGILVNIVTTDAPVPAASVSPFGMPAPISRRIQVRCSLLGQSSVTVPAAFAALLGTAGVTRIQTTVIRPTLLGLTPATAIAGHAIVGFTTVP